MSLHLEQETSGSIKVALGPASLAICPLPKGRVCVWCWAKAVPFYPLGILYCHSGGKLGLLRNTVVPHYHRKSRVGTRLGVGTGAPQPWEAGADSGPEASEIPGA